MKSLLQVYRKAAPVEPSELVQVTPAQTTLTRADLATGRGLTYEWEFFVDQLFQDMAGAGIGPQTFVYDQTAPAAVWTINHGMSQFPSVLLVDGSGQEMIAEIHYPDNQTTVVIHGQPYAGTAYLRI